MKSFLIRGLCCCVLLTSCKQPTDTNKEDAFSPLENGFGVVAKWIGVDSGPGASLYYKGTNETPVLVWPYIGIHGYPILFTNDVALLLADKPDEQGRLSGGALIAVQGVGPAMDIADDVWRRGTLDANSVLMHPARKHDAFSLAHDGGRLSVKYLPRLDIGEGIPQSVKVSVSWEQVFSIMEDVKRTGRTNKVVNTDVLYLQKDYGESVK